MLMIGSLVVLGCEGTSVPSSTKTVAMESRVRWEESELIVCWESEADDLPDFKAKVKQNTDANFNRTVIHLTGWEACSVTDDPDIRVFIYDSPAAVQGPLLALRNQLKSEGQSGGHPRARARGNNLHGMKAGLVLTSKFTDVDHGLMAQAEAFNSTGKANLILGIALHEMGHAIGLRHEDAHPGRTCDTFEEPLGNDEAVTKYNFNSVMSRCFYRNFDYDQGTLAFNKGDVKGIAKAYKHLR